MIRAKALILAIIFAIPLFAFAYPTSFPKATGFVNDTAGMLSASVRQQLENELKNFSESSGYEIAVLTVPNLEGTTVEDFAVRVFEQWKIGDKKLDTGVLFLIARDDRQMRIEVGYGAEPVLTDVQASQILNNIVRPSFKSGNYEEGIRAGIKNIEAALSGSPIAIVQRENQGGSLGGLLNLFIEPIIFIFVGIFFKVIAKVRGWWLGGVIGLVSSVIFILMGSYMPMLLKIGLVVLCTLLGLLLDYAVSKGKWDRGDGSNIWFLGGGRGGSGGGFGGFSGGSSGGGGSSSSW